MRPDRKSGRRERTLPAGGGGVRAASPSSSPPLGWGAGNPAPSPLPWSPRARLGAHRESGRGVRASGWGAHSHPWGVRTPGSAAGTARGAMPFGLPADRNRGAASSFGERSRRRGPRARGGAEPGRGTRAAGRRAGWGVPRAGGHAAGRPTRPRRPSSARNAPSRSPAPSAAAPNPCPPPYPAWEDPPPSAWPRSPCRFSEELWLLKEAKCTKTQRKEGRRGVMAVGFRRPALGLLPPQPPPRVR